ncbi:murein hydrolase activator EnvC family protein [Salinibacter altiplanensis]|uniref:murein hydrolase activator EnvC family protein n=1 Tax=Salinibacter altiplanensis TaxID=1803181 RepID=UPI000C9FE68F|nr:peptidoglycan DD-metalloendopeptidase family protein [Salinibacter altiplanensis]
MHPSWPSRRIAQRAFRTGLVVLLGLAVPVGVSATYGQGASSQRETTRQRLTHLEQQIQQEQQRLQKTEKEAESTQEQLASLQREIALREKLVATYQARLDELGQERSRLRDTLSTLQTRLEALRDDYRGQLSHAYKHGRLHDLALLLASQSINQMLIRARYLRRFATDRRQQRSAIQSATDEVRSSREQLARKRTETRDLLAEARTERTNLRALERERRQVIDELQARRSELEQQIDQKQRQAQQLEERIQKLVARAKREGAASGAEAEVAASLSASFQDNRGALPWPADGAVTTDFGDQVDPVHETTTYHPGILIATSPRSRVRAIFDGTVTGVDFVPGYGTYVVIQHGEYLSVYSNFSSLSIAEGNRIEAGQVIGQAGTESEPRGASLFFGLVDRSSSEFVDPSGWLSAR